MCVNPYLYDIGRKRFIGINAKRLQMTDYDLEFTKQKWNDIDDLGQIQINLFSKKTNLIWIKCGKCIECQKEHSTEWAFRCVNEASLHSSNCMITLTYSNAPPQLIKKDLQDFIKRLRQQVFRKFNIRFKFFACGEYGDLKGRPHFHLIVFGWCPNDLQLFFKRDNHNVYKSEFVANIWKSGFITVEDISVKSALYCTAYLQKFLDFGGKQKSYITMSNGIGKGYISKLDLRSDKVYHEGKYIKIPRYYLKVLEKQNVDLSALKNKRLKKCSIIADNLTYQKALEKFDKQVDFVGANALNYNKKLKMSAESKKILEMLEKSIDK